MRDKRYYSLGKVKHLISQGKVEFDGDALDFAKEDFGWGIDEIFSAFRCLRETDWHKSSPKTTSPDKGIQLDYYKSFNLKGEKVFTHFYIKDDTLFIDSFHDINRRRGR